MPREYLEKLCQAIKNNSNKKHKFFKEIMLDGFGNYLAPKLIENSKKYGLIKHYNFFIDVRLILARLTKSLLVKVYNNSLDALKKVKHGRQLMGKIN